MNCSVVLMNDGTGGSFLRLSGLGIEPSNQALAAPKLNRVAVYESLGPCYLGPCDGLVVVDANERPQAGEMPVVVDSERPIFCHALTIWFGGTEITITDDAEGGAVMVDHSCGTQYHWSARRLLELLSTVIHRP